MRIVMHIDFDYFFAQIEERENPSLKTKPVVVCIYSGRTSESGAVSTANYQARRYGVRSGMPIILAKKKLENKDSVFLPANHRLYEIVSEKVMVIVKKHSDSFEKTSIDEAFIDVTKRTGGNLGKSVELAKTIKNEIMSTEKLSCSIGIGPNKLVAKIASDYRKPDGLTVVSEAEMNNFLTPLPVDKIPGVGRKTTTIFKQLGIQTIGDLSQYNGEHLVEQFGKKIGGYFYSASRGLDKEAVHPSDEPKQFSRIATLKNDTFNHDTILQTITRLSTDIIREISEQRYCFKTVSIITVLQDLSIHSKSITFEKPTDKLEDLISVSDKLLGNLVSELNLPVRRIGVRVSNLAKVKGQKMMLEYL